jgi:FAD/FMN-containing dehydrogenase
MSASHLPSLVSLLGAESVLSAPEDVEPFVVDHRGLYRGRALAVALPRSTEEVSKVLGWCNERRIGVVPHGGNTSYCGGATPDLSGRQLVLCLRRLNRIRTVDPLNFSLTAEAGCVLADVQRAADDAELLFPLSLGAEGTCQIGGNLSTNAGGTQVLRYGMMRDLVLGLEVVLADGRVLSGLTALRKDNTGYEVKALFLGAEGTLGVITAASLKLFPKPAAFATALLAVPDVRAATALLAVIRASSGDRVSAFELMPRIALELLVQHVPDSVDPFEKPYSWYVLCELTSSGKDQALDALLESILAPALEAGLVEDAVIAQSQREREALWRLRESIPEAQRRDGASLKHDVSVPVASLPEFVERAGRWVQTHVPEARLVAYGHLGDGNLHFNLNQAAGIDRDAFVAREPEVRRAIHDLAHAFHGSFSAEHGIGRLKIEELERYASPVELALMRDLKRIFDPNGILNPGKVLRG